MSKFHYQPCDPPVTSITLGDTEILAITARMQQMFTADQIARQSQGLRIMNRT
jgi:hypothetical protein